MKDCTFNLKNTRYCYSISMRSMNMKTKSAGPFSLLWRLFSQRSFTIRKNPTAVYSCIYSCSLACIAASSKVSVSTSMRQILSIYLFYWRKANSLAFIYCIHLILRVYFLSLKKKTENNQNNQNICFFFSYLLQFIKERERKTRRVLTHRIRHTQRRAVDSQRLTWRREPQKHVQANAKSCKMERRFNRLMKKLNLLIPLIQRCCFRRPQVISFLHMLRRFLLF